MLEQVKQSLDPLYQMIGPAGFVLLFFVLVAVYLSLKNFYYLNLVWYGFKKNFNILEEGECVAFDSFSAKGHNPLIDIVSTILKKNHKTEDLRAEVTYLFHKGFEKVSKDLCYLKLISVISPLMGLLGTVLGMIGVFEAIASSSSPDPSELASGIGSALFTTILGLVVAIPTLMVYYFLLLKFKSFHIEAVEYSNRILTICKPQNIED